MGVEEARRRDSVGPSGAPRWTTGLLKARDSGRMLKISKKIYNNCYHTKSSLIKIFAGPVKMYKLFTKTIFTRVFIFICCIKGVPELFGTNVTTITLDNRVS